MRNDLRESSAYSVMSYLPYSLLQSNANGGFGRCSAASRFHTWNFSHETDNHKGASRNFLLHICFSKRIVHLHRVQRVPNAQH